MQALVRFALLPRTAAAFVLAVGLAATIGPAWGQPLANPVVGVVLPSVTVLADATNSYALYLPKNYSPQKRWPLLLAFDPGGDGINPVQLFHVAAEKYGFIVVGSNNSRNFIDPSNAIRLLWGDVRKRYAIDPRRIYTTGFSGGARVASAIAIGCKNCIAGVIACGAGLPAGENLPPPETADWFLTAGTTDFNYPEILRLADAQNARHAATHLAFFPGPHSWMPPDVAEEALAWMQLRAMARGLLPPDKDFIAGEYARRLAAARTFLQSGKTMFAFRVYREIINDFHSLQDVKDLASETDALAKSDELKKAKKSEQAILELQDRTVEKISAITSAIIDKQKPAAVLAQQMEVTMREIRSDQESTSDQARRDALTRGIAGAFAFARESGSDLMLKKDYLMARDLFIATTIIRPGPWPNYLVSLADARLGNSKAALDELRKAVDLGLKDPQILDDPAFDRLRDDAAFKEIAARIAPPATKTPAN